MTKLELVRSVQLSLWTLADEKLSKDARELINDLIPKVRELKDLIDETEKEEK